MRPATPTLSELPLRQRKFARTRLDLLGALVERMASRPIEDISIRELCRAADVSEASFFNYFPKKTDLLGYFIAIWSLEVGAVVARAVADGGARAGIEALFEHTARKVAEQPRIMAEVIAFQARMNEKPDLGEITIAERLLAFPALPEAVGVPAVGLDGILPPLIARAIADGELPPSTDRQDALLLLAAVFFGVPAILGPRSPRKVGAAYEASLDVVWDGLRARGGTTSPRRARARHKR